jgi:hypothetical protein
MTRPLLAWALAFVVGVPQPGLRAEAASDPDLAKGIRQVEDGEFDAAVLTLDGVARRTKERGGAAPELARAQLYLGVAYAGLGKEATAKSWFVHALENDRALMLSPRQFPPRVLQLLDEARLEVGGSPRAAASPKPPSSKAGGTKQASAPPKEKGGSKKGLWIGLGAAAVGGIAIAAAAGGGGGTSGSSPSPAPSTPPGTPRAVISGITPTGQYLARVTRVFFSGRQSSDPEGQSLSYSWDFGDGSAPATAGDVAHTFGVCTCTVRLTVTDTSGLSNTATVTVTSRKLDGSWTGQYSGNLPGFSVVLSQGTTNFSGPLSDGSEMRGILSDPRNIRFLIDNTPRPNCLESRSFEGTVSADLDRIDATGDNCSGNPVGLTLTR